MEVAEERVPTLDTRSAEATIEPLPAMLMLVLPMPTTVLKAVAEALPVMVLARTELPAAAIAFTLPFTILRSVLGDVAPVEVSLPKMAAVIVLLCALAAPVVV